MHMPAELKFFFLSAVRSACKCTEGRNGSGVPPIAGRAVEQAEGDGLLARDVVRGGQGELGYADGRDRRVAQVQAAQRLEDRPLQVDGDAWRRGQAVGGDDFCARDEGVGLALVRGVDLVEEAELVHFAREAGLEPGALSEGGVDDARLHVRHGLREVAVVPHHLSKL